MPQLYLIEEPAKRDEAVRIIRESLEFGAVEVQEDAHLPAQVVFTENDFCWEFPQLSAAEFVNGFLGPFHFQDPLQRQNLEDELQASISAKGSNRIQTIHQLLQNEKSINPKRITQEQWHCHQRDLINRIQRLVPLQGMKTVNDGLWVRLQKQNANAHIQVNSDIRSVLIRWLLLWCQKNADFKFGLIVDTPLPDWIRMISKSKGRSHFFFAKNEEQLLKFGGRKEDFACMQ